MSPEPAPPSPDSAHDAIYPLLVRAADSGPIGDQNYLLHFDADIMPPAAAFWSVTMYEAEGFQAANELDRFALGDRDPLHYNDDGSLDICLQHTNPARTRNPTGCPHTGCRHR